MTCPQLSDTLVFSSARFPVDPAEDAFTSPGVYGRALCDWLVWNLQERGFHVCSVRPTAIGHVITVRERPVRITITCSNVSDERTRWRVVVATEQTGTRPVSWFPNVRTEIAAACRVIESLVESLPDASALVWHSSAPNHARLPTA